MAKSYYTILGIPSRSSAAEIKAAYRHLVKQFHPDHYAGGSRPFQDIQEAYSVLGNPGRRQEYDSRLTRHAQPRSDTARPGPRWPQAEPIAERPRAEPLVPERGPADLGEISLVRSFQTFSPSFDEIFDWLWSNFRSLSHSKSGSVRNLTAEVPITPEEARRGGQARVLVPAQATCPTCRGLGGVGPYLCARCAGEGVITGEFPLTISVPPGLASDHSVLVPLDRFGIRNLHLTVWFRIAPGP